MKKHYEPAFIHLVIFKDDDVIATSLQEIGLDARGEGLNWFGVGGIFNE